MILRVIASTILFLSVLFMPFWFSIILALAGMIYFSYFIEAPVLLLLSDLLYGVPSMNLLKIIFMPFVLASSYLFVVEFIKKKIRY